MFHKSVFVSPLSQPIFFDRHNEGTILQELFRKLKRRELDIMKTPDITFINEDRCSVHFKEVTRGVLGQGEEVVYVLC